MSMNSLLPTRHIVKNPENNNTQRIHDPLARSKIVREAAQFPHNAEAFFDSFPEKYHIKPNYNLKKSITKIAVKLSGTVAKPNRTHLRYLDCTNAYINSNWELLQPHLESLRNINTIKDEKGKKVGFEIFIGPEGSEPWIADKKGDVSGIFEGRSKKRNLKKEIEQEKRFQEQETRFLEQNSMTFHVLPSSPEIDFDFNSYTSDYEMGLFADEFDTFDDI